MGITPFKNDIFISYKHVANEDYVKWVDALRNALQTRLTELVGKVEFWRDKDALRAGDQWDPQIATALEQTAIFLAVISRTYFDPGVCPEELDRFLKLRKESGEGEQRLIVPIFKQPPKSDDLVPQELAAIHHHQFFEWNPTGTTNFREFRPGTGDETQGRFWETFERLAQDLMYQIEKLEGRAEERAAATIFLANVAPELHDERERLRSDLQQRGYRVVPQNPYLWNSSSLGGRLAADLGKADLCVHLLTSAPTNDPDSHKHMKLQLEQATETMKDKAKILVWIRPATEIDAGARAVIEYVEKELSNKGVDYLRGPLEDFKTLVFDKLPRAAPASASLVAEAALLVEDADLAAASEIRSFLAERLKVEPVRVKLSGAVPTDLSFLDETLQRCTRCIVYWGAQPEEWVNRILRLDALTQHLGQKQLCVYAAAPATPDKNAFTTTKARIVHCSSGVNEVDLRDFLVAEAR